MTKLKAFAVIALLPLVGFFLATAPSLAQKSPDKISLSADDKDGVVLIKVDRDVARLDVWLQKSGRSGFGSRVYTVTGKETGSGEYYIARTLKPARYRISSI